MPNRLPHSQLLNDLLDYDPLTGRMTWKERKLEYFGKVRFWKAWNIRFAGKDVESVLHKTGYFQIKILGKRYKTHRIIWKLATGNDPKDIDHINRDRSDNRLANLRSVNRVVNTQNCKKSKANTSGYTGVQFHKQSKLWLAVITVKYQRFHLGLFHTKDEAISARRAAESEHGFHANHGRG